MLLLWLCYIMNDGSITFAHKIGIKPHTIIQGSILTFRVYRGQVGLIARVCITVKLFFVRSKWCITAILGSVLFLRRGIQNLGLYRLNRLYFLQWSIRRIVYKLSFLILLSLKLACDSRSLKEAIPLWTRSCCVKLSLKTCDEL